MCGIVATADSPSTPRTPTLSATTQPQVLWRDENFTVYKEKANPVSSKGHIIVAFNPHVPSIYALTPSDIPLLLNIRDIATRLLTSLLLPPQSPYSTSPSVPPPTVSSDRNDFRIGFITPPFKDTKIPVSDHLHAHAFIPPGDLIGWWRGIAYSPLAWYDIDDLIAEIREASSNNRIRSGNQVRPNAPIEKVPGACARTGTADGRETSMPSIGFVQTDLEEGQQSSESSPRTSSGLMPDSASSL